MVDHTKNPPMEIPEYQNIAKDPKHSRVEAAIDVCEADDGQPTLVEFKNGKEPEVLESLRGLLDIYWEDLRNGKI